MVCSMVVVDLAALLTVAMCPWNAQSVFLVIFTEALILLGRSELGCHCSLFHALHSLK